MFHQQHHIYDWSGIWFSIANNTNRCFSNQWIRALNRVHYHSHGPPFSWDVIFCKKNHVTLFYVKLLVLPLSSEAFAKYSRLQRLQNIPLSSRTRFHYDRYKSFASTVPVRFIWEFGLCVNRLDEVRTSGHWVDTVVNSRTLIIGVT